MDFEEVGFIDYLIITGRFLSSKTATGKYFDNGECVWFGKKGDILAKRLRYDNKFTNYVESSIAKAHKMRYGR